MKTKKLMLPEQEYIPTVGNITNIMDIPSRKTLPLLLILGRDFLFLNCFFLQNSYSILRTIQVEEKSLFIIHPLILKPFPDLDLYIWEGLFAHESPITTHFLGLLH